MRERWISLIHVACFACNLDDMAAHGSDNSFLRWAATYTSDRDHVRERLSGRIVDSRTRSAAGHSQSGSTWNFDWLFKAQQYWTTQVHAFVREATVHGISHMCDDGFYGSEIDVNVATAIKRSQRAKTDLANIREHEERRQWPRGRTIGFLFFFSPPCFEKPSTLIRSLTGYECFCPRV